MVIKWNKYNICKPKSSGFYLVKKYNEIEILYYCKDIDRFLYFEYDFSYAYMMPGHNIHTLLWAKFNRIPKTKLLYNGYLELEEKN